MRKIVFLIVFAVILIVPVSAVEFTTPEPESAQMPENTTSFSEGLLELLERGLLLLRPDLREALQTATAVVGAVMLSSLLQSFPGSVGNLSETAATVVIASVLLLGTNSLITLGKETTVEMSDYGKLLLPVMTAAMAAGGGVTASAALYAGTAAFDTLLAGAIRNVLVPMVYLFLALSVAGCALGEDVLKRLRDLLKGFMSWCLKTLLTVFTAYMSITGVVSGTTDAATLKATKVTISTVVPVVGGILSDASEAVLVSAGVMKSAAGIYGILAVLAIYLEPFVRIGTHYLILKLSSALCGVFGPKRLAELAGDFSTAMGLLLAMTGSVCLLLLISTVCFMKGVG